MLPEIFTRLKEIGAEVAPITDTASTFGYAKWAKGAKDAGLRPIFGVELSVTPAPNAKKPVSSAWTFLAHDSIQPINRLVNLATSQFRYEPLLTYEQAMTVEGVTKIAGHAALLSEMSPAPDLFMGLSPSSPRGQVVAAMKAGFRLIAIGDNRFPAPGDLALYELAAGRNSGTQTYPQHILSEEEWREAMAMLRLTDDVLDGALVEASIALERSTASLRKATMVKPARPKTLREMAEDGARRRGIDLADPVYAARLERELSIIEAKRLEDYFFLMADIMQFSRAHMLCGPARGSAAGSLLSFLLDITTIDPIPGGLLFERFLDVTRGGWFFKTDWLKNVMETES
jgi:DNA polymerase III alpha subunit